MSDPVFKRGDIVQLISGGPPMVAVERIVFWQMLEPIWKCRWFDPTGRDHEGNFPEDLLVTAALSEKP